VAQLDYVDGRAVHVALTPADLEQLVREREIVVDRERDVTRALVVRLDDKGSSCR
jgi:hypothetical protein